MSGQWRVLLRILVAITLASCGHEPMKPIPPVSQVDLARFMGDWYVIAHIPSRPERHAYDAIESYRLAPDGRILTTFRYRNKSFDAPLKTMSPVGTVRPGTGNAMWGMQFFWPIQAEYVIVDVNDTYTQTIVGRSKRDYAWIMARTPKISDADYGAAVSKLQALSYDVAKVRKVPHRLLR